VVVEALRRNRVDTVFGYIGAAVIGIFDALYDAEDIRLIVPRHEQAAAHAADAYARVTGRPGLVIATSGPGSTNLVTGIANAHLDSSPVVFLTGQVKRHLIGNDAFQEVDTTGVTRPICKHSVLVKDPEALPRVLAEAFHIATTGRPGPVVVDLPADVSAAVVAAPFPERIDLPGYRLPDAPNPTQIGRAAEVISSACRPVLLAGGGIIHANASQAFRTFAEATGAPVVSTLMGLGSMPAQHPQWLGMAGMHGRVCANRALMQADAVVAVGARFSDRVTGPVERFAPGARIVHIDIDPSVIGMNLRADVPVVADAGAAMAALTPRIDPVDRTDWWRAIASWRGEDPRPSKGRGLKPQAILASLAELTADRRTIVCTEVGQHQMWAAQGWPVDAPRTWVTSGGLGTMGFGMPAAIGAQFACPDARVVNISGDGSFQMNLQELATLAQYGLPVKTVILNNSYLGMVRQWQQLFRNRRYAGTVMEENPDFARVAQSFGVKGMRLSSRSRMRSTLQRFLAHEGPVVLDARIEREENVFPMVPAGNAIDAMLTEG
jgi:acetolactate synthase-1/2/3 large subunit